MNIVSGRLIACYYDACEIFQSGNWQHLQSTLEGRRQHSTATTGDAVLLIGGPHSQSTELICADGSYALLGPFTLHCQPWTQPLHCHSCNLSPAPPALLVYFFPAGVLFSTENAKGTTLNMPCHAISINKYANQKQQVHQSKQQICHLNQKTTPTKTPNTPSQ